MIPILYEGNETSFTTNGLGRLADAISCKVVEELNSVYELEMTYPVDGVHYDDIQENRIILAQPFDGGQTQPFLIYKITKPINGIVTVNAEHISYRLTGITVMPYTASSATAAIAGVKTNSAITNPFNFSTDKTVTASFSLTVPKSAREILCGGSGSILDVYGKGDYEFNRFNVFLRQNRGSNNGVTLRYGKNITDLKSVVDMSSVYTGICPYWADTEGNTVTLTEKVVMSGHENLYPYKIIKAVDFSADFDTQPTESQLRTRAQAYVTNNEGWKLKNNITVSFIALWNTEEYKDIAPLERVKMCDTVHVIYTKLGVDFTTKVIKTDYDVLMERYNSITLGDTPYSFTQFFEEEIIQAQEEQMSSLQKAIEHATELITGGLGGHVVFNLNADGEPQEILIMDTDSIQTAVNVIRMNKNGIGFSTTGYNGPFSTAWTIDGSFVADYITSGTLDAALVKTGLLQDYAGLNYWNMRTGDFRLTSGYMGGSPIANTSDVSSGDAATLASAEADATSKVSNYDTSLNQQKVFNKLTNNGAAQGIYMTNGELYINATYIQSGTMVANRVRTGLLTDEQGYNYWNLTTGEFRLSANTTVGGSTVSEIAHNASSAAVNSYDSTLNQTAIFNKLTNNGAAQGIYMSGGQLYINAAYIATGTLSDPNGKTTFDLSTGRLDTENFTVNSTNFTLDAQGNMTATSATLENATLNNASILSDNTVGPALNIDNATLMFIYNNNALAFIQSDYGYWDSAYRTYLNIASSGNINFDAHDSWNGDVYSSGVNIGQHEMSLYTGTSGAISDFALDWSGNTHILGDQYENLSISFDTYGNPYLDYDTVWFEAGNAVIDGVSVTNVQRIDTWGY